VHRFSIIEPVKPRDVSNPLNRFRELAVAYDDGLGPPPAKVTLLEDQSRSILSRNDSPDLGFRWSANPYRGCLHACAYCYARPTHEYLDLGAGTDFDTKIVVKRDAPELLRAAFDKPSWQGELVMFSGVTDCYQPIEKELELTRRCLEVCLEYKNPVSVISKSALVLRDVELFRALAAEARFHIAVSLAFTDNEQSRAIEPWAASPDRRFKVIEALAAAGLPVSVMIAPVIPGVNDSQMVGVLERARAAGAVSAGWTLLRLPGAVKDVFEERVRAVMPLAADKVLHRIRETRGGEKLNDARFHSRGRGEGPYAETLATMFAATCRRLGFDDRDDAEYDDRATFRRPPPRTGQLPLF
jgi:DNA repair photolyase